MMNETDICKVAVVGAGYMAKEHILAFQDIEGVEIVGITSRTRKRAEEVADSFNIQNVCDSVSELYVKTKADLVVVSVPELSANKVSKACFEFPWTVLLEKPAGYNLQDAKDILTCAQMKNSNAYVALNRRHYSSTRIALNGLSDNENARWIYVQDQQDQVVAQSSGQPKEVVDNWMYANSVHVIDYFKLFGRGEIKSVEQIVPWSPQSPWLVVAKIIFDSGDVGLYEGIWCGPGPWSVSISTTEKRWEMRPLEQVRCQNAGERTVESLELHEWDQQFKPGLRLQAQEAVLAAAGKENNLPTLQDAFDSMKLVNSIFKV